jgi:hypothetical protein
MKVLEKLPSYEKIPHEKSYLNILNGNQDIYNLRFLVFLTLHGYFMIFFGDANLTVQCISLVHKGFIFNSAKKQCNFFFP